MSSFNNDINIGEVSPDLSPEDISTGFFYKFALMILIIIFVVFSVKFSIQLILYLMSPSNSPIIIDGRIDGTESRTFTQNPGLSKSKTIQRSKNEKGGLEFTWSTWLYIKESSIDSINPAVEYKHIFSKGDNVNNIWENEGSSLGAENMNSGMIWPNASPGLYLRATPTPTSTTSTDGGGNQVELKVAMTTFGGDSVSTADGETNMLPIVETIDIDNIPLNKWINIIIRVKGLIVDIYINGIIVKRHILQSTPKQNYGDIHTALNGGFNGYISYLRYFDYAIEVGKISSIIDKGPSLKTLSNQSNNKNRSYMSSRWYFNY